MSNAAKKTTLDTEVLVTENYEYACKLAHTMLRRWQVLLNRDDIESAIGLALAEAASRFDESKGAHFRTFLFYHLRGVLLREVSDKIDSEKLNRPLENFSETSEFVEKTPAALVEKSNPEGLAITNQRWSSIRTLAGKLESLEKEVITRHYFENKSLSDIAEELNYCRCHISRVKKSALQNMKSAAGVESSSDFGSAPIGELGKNKYRGGRGRRSRTVEKKSKNTKVQLAA